MFIVPPMQSKAELNNANRSSNKLYALGTK